jgi:hypothetical protein
MKIPVSDPFGAANDPQLPQLQLALDPVEARKELRRGLPRLSGESGKVRLRSICVTRHKPGRRCVVEYDVRVERPGETPSELTLIGKTRARRFGNESYRLQDQIWNAGFNKASPDGIAVPEPLGVIPCFQMWFQRKVAGRNASDLMVGAEGITLARRLAEAIHKLHRAAVPTERAHGMSDELRILRECLAKVAEIRPEWDARLRRVVDACADLGGKLAPVAACGIHRDFYPAQVLVDDSRICLIDFDLYCLGDPGLDVGNFIGHLTESGVREFGRPDALSAQERALEERFLELAGQQTRQSVRTYAILTLVRHIYLSTQFADRQPLTEQLLEVCEQRLAVSR